VGDDNHSAAQKEPQESGVSPAAYRYPVRFGVTIGNKPNFAGSIRMFFTTCVAGSFSGTDFCLIFAP